MAIQCYEMGKTFGQTVKVSNWNHLERFAAITLRRLAASIPRLGTLEVLVGFLIAPMAVGTMEVTVPKSLTLITHGKDSH